ncbi:MAG: AAA family ATPase [Burkholderiales bacterium]
MSSPSPARGNFLALLSCKGGVGTTFLTTQLGCLLALRWQLKVLIIDSVHPFGDAALMLSHKEPPATLSDLLRHPERCDQALLESALLWPQPRLGMLAAPDKPLQDDLLSPEKWLAILEAARAHFDFILVDCGRTVDARMMTLLRTADRLLPVLQTTLPMIRDGRRLLSALIERGIDPLHILPVLNRVSTTSMPQPKTLDRALGTHIVHRIPEDPALVGDCIQSGQALWIRAPFHPISQSLITLARTLVPAPEPTGTLSRGLLHRWWKKQWRWNPQHS